MMKPEMTSSTASRVVTMMDSDPLTAAMLTRTSSSTLQRHDRALHAVDNCVRSRGVTRNVAEKEALVASPARHHMQGMR